MADYLTSVMSGALRGTTVTVRTRVGSYTFDATGAADDGPPSMAVKILRPSVTLARDGQVLIHTAPAGEPEEGAWILFALGSALLVSFVAWLLAR